MDYIVPQHNRYLGDACEAFPIDITFKKIVIPGTGDDPVDLTETRLLATALALLITQLAWEPFTYVSGEKTTWYDLVKLVQERCPDMNNIQYVGLGQILHTTQSISTVASRGKRVCLVIPVRRVGWLWQTGFVRFYASSGLVSESC